MLTARSPHGHGPRLSHAQGTPPRTVTTCASLRSVRPGLAGSSSCEQRRRAQGSAQGPKRISATNDAAQALELAAHNALRHQGEDEASVQRLLGDLRHRLAGWPAACLSAGCPVLPPALEWAEAGPASSVGVTKVWPVPGGSLVVSSESTHADGIHAYAVAVTHLHHGATQPGHVSLHWTSRGGWLAHAVQEGTLALTHSMSGDAEAGLRRGSARILPRDGVCGLSLRLQTAQVVSGDLTLPLPCGLLSQLAADAAASGGCVAHRTLSLGREHSGSLLAVVRDTGEQVCVELFSDAPHPLILHWGVLDRQPAPGGKTAWLPPPPEMRGRGGGAGEVAAAQSAFHLFTAEVDDAESGAPARATLQRCCLAFNSAAADEWAGLAFVLRSEDGSMAWQDDWGHFVLPWADDACAVAWEASPYTNATDDDDDSID